MKAVPKRLNKKWEKENRWSILINDEFFLGIMTDEELRIFKCKEFKTFEDAENFIKNHKKLKLGY